MWGTYQLYQSPKGIYMKEAEVQEDFWSLRSRPSAMIMALRWARWLDRFLIEKYPYDDLLALFYWALRALQKGVGTEAIQARFLWKWLQSWGSAPDLMHCVSCGAPLEGRGFFIGDGLLCRDCSGDGGIPLVLDRIAPYVMAPRFLQVSDFESQELRDQSKNLSNCLLKSLESYR